MTKFWLYALAMFFLADSTTCGGFSHGSGLTEDPNEVLKAYLEGQTLHFRRLGEGEEIAPDTLLMSFYDPDCDRQKPVVVVSFEREDFPEEFLQDLLEYKKDYILKHPFTYLSVETVLTGRKVMLVLYEGLLFNLRTSIDYDGLKVDFLDRSAKGKVLLVRGNVMASFDHAVISDKLASFYLLGSWTSGFSHPLDEGARRNEGNAFMDPGARGYLKKYPPKYLSEKDWQEYINRLKQSADEHVRTSEPEWFCR